MSSKQPEHIGISPSSHLTTPSENNTIAWSGFYELTKPRLSFMSVISALLGYLAAPSSPDRGWELLFHFLVGTALCAGGAAALNQWCERHTDTLMDRTRDRPLPSGQVTPTAAFAFGIILSVGGCAQLYFGANPLAGTLGIATIVSYVAIYTPLKRVTVLATEFGTLPGAVPPLIGWAAATGEISTLGWILFALLAFWQLPHFMAISWMYREDFAKAKFPMLTVIDPSGRKAGIWAVITAVALLVVSLLPVYFEFCGYLYGVVASVFGIWFIARSVKFAQGNDRDAMARKLFFNSIIYLPVVLFSLVIDRWIQL